MSAAGFDSIARGLAGLGGAAMLVLALAALLAWRPAMAVRVMVAQAACLAVVLAAQAWLQGSWWLLAVAGFTLSAKAIALPLGMRALVPAVADTSGRGVIGPAAMAVALAGLAVAATPAVLGLGAAIALAVMLVGGFAALRHAGPFAPVIGVLVIENGLVLAIGSASGLGGMALLAVATAALPVAAVLVLVQRLLPGREGA